MSRFSIIIPAHNAGGHICNALDSIINQSFNDYELIVVCDSCSDATESVAQSYGAITDNVSFHRDGLTRDHALTLATGEWILFMDDDDWFTNPFALQQINSAIVANPDVDIVAFGVQWPDHTAAPNPRNLFTPRLAHVWDKAWKHTTITKANAHFGDAIFCSDTYFLRDMRDAVKAYATIPDALYYYNFRRPGSQTDLFCKGIIHQSPVAE